MQKTTAAQHINLNFPRNAIRGPRKLSPGKCRTILGNLEILSDNVGIQPGGGSKKLQDNHSGIPNEQIGVIFPGGWELPS